MSLLTKRVFGTSCFKNFLNYELYFIRYQYYTSLNSSCCINSQIRKTKADGLQRISSLKTVRELNFDFRKGQNLISNAFDKVFSSQKFRQKYVGFLWYKSLDEVNVNQFITLLQMPDIYFSWFNITALHVWMLLFQMNQVASNLRYVRDGVVEAMWLDMEKRAELLEPYNKNFKKNFKQLYSTFRDALFWYDYGYLDNDMMLTNVVWVFFFERKCDDPEKLEAVVRFIRCQLKHLETVNLKCLDENEKTGIWTSIKPHYQRLLT